MQIPGVDRTRLTDVSSMRGEDEEETRLLKAHLNEARAYLGSYAWGRTLLEIYFGGGVGGIVAVFLVRLPPDQPTDEWLWVVVGDLPSAYLVTDHASTPSQALSVYCELMEDWANAVLGAGDLGEVYPVAAEPTDRNARSLLDRVRFLRGNVVDWL